MQQPAEIPNPGDPVLYQHGGPDTKVSKVLSYRPQRKCFRVLTTDGAELYITRSSDVTMLTWKVVHI